MARTQLAKINHADLIEWRKVLSEYEIACTGHTGWSPEECAAKLRRYYEFFSELKERYLDPDDREEFVSIGPVLGDILLDEDD